MAKKKDAGSDAAPKYGEAVVEIEQILESIDKDEVDVDDLSVKVERAVQLIRLCQEKLRATEIKVNKVLQDLAEVDLEDDAKDEADEDSGPESQDKGEVDEAASSSTDGSPSAAGTRPRSRPLDPESDDELPF